MFVWAIPPFVPFPLNVGDPPAPLRKQAVSFFGSMKRKSYYLSGSHGVVKRPLVGHKGMLLKSINAYGEKPFSVVRFSPISDTLVAVDQRGNLFVIDVETKHYDVVFRFGFTPDKLAFSPKKERPYEFLISNIDGKVVCANLRTKTKHSDLDHNETPQFRKIMKDDPIIRSVCYHPLENNVLVTCTRKNVHFWKLNSRFSHTVSQNYYMKEKKFHSRQEKLRSGVYYYSKRYGQFIFLSILNQEILMWKEIITLSNRNKNKKRFRYELIDRIDLPHTEVIDVVEEGSTNVYGMKTKDENKLYQTQEYISCFDIYQHFIVVCTNRSNVRVYDLETCGLLFSTKLPLRPRSIPLKGEEFIPKKVKFLRNKSRKMIFDSENMKLRKRKKNQINENTDYKDFVILHKNNRKSVLLFFHVLDTTTTEIRCFGPPISPAKTIVDFDISRSTNYLSYSNAGYELFVYKIYDFIRNRCTLYHYPKEPFPLHTVEKHKNFKRIEDERDQLNDLLDKFGQYPDKYRGAIWKTLLMVHARTLANSSGGGGKKEEDVEIPPLESYDNDPHIQKLIDSLNEIGDRGVGSACKYIKNPNFQALLIAIYRSIPQIRDFLFSDKSSSLSGRKRGKDNVEQLISRLEGAESDLNDENSSKVFYVEDIPLIDIIYPFYRLYGEHDLLSSYECCLSFLRYYRSYFLYHDFSPSSYYHRRMINCCHYNPNIMDHIEILLKQLDEKVYLHLFHHVKARRGVVVGSSSLSPQDVVRRIIWKKFIVPCFTSNFGIRSWYRFMDHVLSRCYNLEECVVGYLLTHRSLIMSNVKNLGDFTFFSEQVYCSNTSSDGRGLKRIVGMIESVKLKNNVSIRKRWEPLYYYDNVKFIKDNNPRDHYLKTRELDIDYIPRKKEQKRLTKKQKMMKKMRMRKKLEEGEEEEVDGKERETRSIPLQTTMPIPRSAKSIPRPASFMRPMLDSMPDELPPVTETAPFEGELINSANYNVNSIVGNQQQQQRIVEKKRFKEENNNNNIPSQEFSLHLRRREGRRTRGYEEEVVVGEIEAEEKPSGIVDGKETEGKFEMMEKEESEPQPPQHEEEEEEERPVLLQSRTVSIDQQPQQPAQVKESKKGKKSSMMKKKKSAIGKKKAKMKKKKKSGIKIKKKKRVSFEEEGEQKSATSSDLMKLERERKIRYKEKVDVLKKRLEEKEEEIMNMKREMMMNEVKQERDLRLERKIESTKTDLKELIKTKFDDFMYRQKQKEIESRVRELDDISTADVSITSSSSSASSFDRSRIGGNSKLFDIEIISSSSSSDDEEEDGTRDASLFSIPSQVLSDDSSFME